MIHLLRLNVARIVDTEEEAQVLIDQGFTLVEEPKVQGKPLDKMSVAELEDYASERGIDLAGCSSKPDKLARIKEVEDGE